MTPTPPTILAAGRYDGDATVFTHAHPCPELLLVGAGDLRVEVPDLGFSCAAPAGSLLLLPGRRDHRHVGRGRASTAWILVRGPVLGGDDAPRLLPLRPEDPARTWFGCIVDLHRSGDAGGTRQLLAALLERAGAAERRHGHGSALHPAVLRAQQLIDADPVRAWSLAGLARGSGVAGPHLAALFRAQMGSTPLRYQTRIRLEIAERLLADPYRSVAAVARDLGLEANYFCRIFRRHRRCSPAAWRRAQESGVIPPAAR